MTFWINISENLSLFINAAKQLIIMRPACCCELDKTCISGESDPPFVLLLSGVWTWRIKIKIMSCRLPPPHQLAATASEAVSSLHFPAVSRPAAAPPCAGAPHSLSRLPAPASQRNNQHIQVHAAADQITRSKQGKGAALQQQNHRLLSWCRK